MLMYDIRQCYIIEICTVLIPTYTVDLCTYFTLCPLIYEGFLVIIPFFIAHILWLLSFIVLHTAESWVTHGEKSYPVILTLTQTHFMLKWRKSHASVFMWMTRGRAFLSHYLRITHKCSNAVMPSAADEATAYDLPLFSCSDYSVTAHGRTMGVTSSQQRLLTSGQRWCIQDARSGCESFAVRLSWNAEL